MHIIVSGRFMRVENIKGTPNTIMYMNVLRTFAAEILKTSDYSASAQSHIGVCK